MNVRSCYGAEAWKLNEILQAFNNEEAYFGDWLYLWPDGCDKAEAYECFDNEEDYKELENCFIKKFKAYASNGLYTTNARIIENANAWAKKLGIENLKNYKEVE